MKYGRLTIINGTKRRIKKGNENRYYVDVKCDCGTLKTVCLRDLEYRNTKSCGCWSREKCIISNKKRLTTHNMSYSSTYKTWNSMLNRCRSKEIQKRKYYLDKGIKVCARWHKFENFFEDMGERPEKLTIDRIDNSKGYYKQNCRWATLKGQANNKTNNNLVEYKGEIKNISQWANVLGKNRSFIYSRIKDGQLNLS